MRPFLAVSAASLAILLPAGPASAGDNDRPLVGIPGDGFGSDFRVDRRRVRGHGGDIFLGDWEYTGNQVWRSDSFNDWWHERPDRAYPAWVQRNRDCQRKWWSGDSLRC